MRPALAARALAVAGAIRTTIDSVASVAEQASAAAQEVAASIEEVSAATAEIAATATGQADVSRELRELVGSFRV